MRTAKTRVEPVQAQLRGEILSGGLVPGSKLPLAEIASRLQASVGVVREALIRLTSEGLVVAEPQLGFRVAAVSEKDLHELIDTRLVVECEAFRSAIIHGSVDWESDVIGAYHRLHRVERDADGERNKDAWVTAHRDFHETLLAGCPNSRLVAVAMSLRDAAELYRSASVSAMTEADEVRRDAEHLALRDAATGRDLAGGPELLGEHIRMTARYLDGAS